MGEASIINIMTYSLPYKLANQIFNEYHERLKEVNFLIVHTQRFTFLRESKNTVELLLALSIFYKRVITNLDAAVKFHGTVKKYSQLDTIKIGEYILDTSERNKILSVTLSYQQLVKKYGIDNYIMDYNETREFLDRMVILHERDSSQNER